MQSAIFRDRIDAAKELVERLYWLEHKIQENKSEAVIVAIPRGGVIGDVIASELGMKLDLVVSRKIGAPFNPELAIGAVMPDGSYFLNEVANMINISQDYIDTQVSKEVNEITDD
jgi:putative phosphoribosyl transferase